MKSSEQVEYLNQLLSTFANNAGIDINREISRKALIFIHDEFNDSHADYEPNELKEIKLAAEELLSIHGKTETGKTALIHLGGALLFSEGKFFFLDIPLANNKDYEFDKGRAICDFAFSAGVACAHLSSVAKLRGGDQISRYFGGRTSRDSLILRKDFADKDGFVDFCRGLIEQGKSSDVATIDDLLNIEGYDPALMSSYGTETLKKWAREAGILFKRGRPKTK